ncbi:MAG: CPBP family intramembrane metalloprotease [Oscillospiraceae bacterium]|jgi:membrane protease YdiL (CAAX protease family)|nr:CPBP family intramembrane metalloprotease [Oscillospiraceae bacterium]
MDNRRNGRSFGIAVAALTFAGAVIALLGLSIAARGLGLWATMVTELGMSAVAVLAALLLPRKPREIYLPRRPRAKHFFGSVFMFFGAWLIMMSVTVVQTLLFPQESASVSQGVNDMVTSRGLLPAILVICVAPAICEEVVFRGTILNALQPIRHDWVRITIVAALFGLMHGDPVRMLPTAILGGTFAYIVLRTGNILYPMLWHFANNLFSTLMAFWALNVLSNADADMYETVSIVDYTAIYIGTVLIAAGGGALLLYGGQRRLRGIALADVNRKRRVRIQTACLVAMIAGVAVMLAGCGVMVGKMLHDG